MSNNEGQVERIIAEACQTFATGPIPDDARRGASAVILDWLGCALLGAETPLAAAMVKAHDGEIGQGTATCFVGPSVCSPNLAALINGTVSHALELDDIYSPAFYHPGVCVISAASLASTGARRTATSA